MGVEITVKDNISTRDLTMICRVEELSFVPSYDATVVNRLLHASGAIVGIASMEAFAVGPRGQWSEFVTVKNTINSDRVP
jgi:aspartyl-tRNA(Asn)/glutamyl-tRNA(Gln) amidotransferase subunit A